MLMDATTSCDIPSVWARRRTVPYGDTPETDKHNYMYILLSYNNIRVYSNGIDQK